MKNSHASTSKKQITLLKMVKGFEQTLPQRRNSDGQQAHEKMLHIANHQGNANQNHNKIPPHTSQNSYHSKDKK